MTFQFITADERMARPGGIKGVVLGPAKIGKTSLLWTLPAESTLFVDLEAGDLSVDGWQGQSVDIRKGANDAGLTAWAFLTNLACWLGGPNPAVGPEEKYSKGHFDHACTIFGDPAVLDKFETIFFDSITVASRVCFSWAMTQPAAFSEKTGKPDTRGAYGLLGREMVAFLTQLQHARGKNVWFVGILDKVKDDYGRTEWVPQIEGGATGKALAGIVDQIISMVELDFDGTKARAFVTQSLNEWGYPAGDRSGQLDLIEEPHLGKIMDKIRAAGRARAGSFDYGIPTGDAAGDPETPTPAADQPTTDSVAPTAEPVNAPAPQWGEVAPPTKSSLDDEILF